MEIGENIDWSKMKIEKGIVIFQKDYQDAEFDEHTFKPCKPYLMENKEGVLRALESTPFLQAFGDDVFEDVKILSISCLSLAISLKADFLIQYYQDDKAISISFDTDEFIISGEDMLSAAVIAMHTPTMGIFPSDSGKTEFLVYYYLGEKGTTLFSKFREGALKTTEH